MELLLARVDILAEDFKIRTSSGKEWPASGLFYRGIVAQQETESVVSLAVFGDEMIGSISTVDGQFSLGKLQGTAADQYVLYNESKLPPPTATCETPDDQFVYDRQELSAFALNGRDANNCVRIYLETDFSIYERLGSVATVSNYIIGLFNQMATLYANEQINTTLSELFIWDTQDPYFSSSASDNLRDFRSIRETFNGDLAGLLSFESSGGIAYVDVLCNSRYAYSFSAINDRYLSVPAYSWSVNVITHEFGHLLGAQHTHACVWNGNGTALDGCFNVQGACARPGIPEAGGTIMSYCHLQSVGVDFANGFGPQPGNLIRNRVFNAGCLTSCETNEKADDSTAVVDTQVQYGAITLDGNWKRVSFSSTFEEPPVLVIGGLSSWDQRPVTVQIRAVTVDDFEVRLANWSYQTDPHGEEDAYFLAAPEGVHELEGVTLVAGSTRANHRMRAVVLDEAAKGTPVVLASQIGIVDPEPTTVRMQAVSQEGFEVRIQEEEASADGGNHAEEQVDYMVLTTGTGSIGESEIVVGRTGDKITHRPRTIAFGTTFANAPFLLSAMQSFDGGDPATTRYSDLAEGSVGLYIDEEQSLDQERVHTTEEVGWVAIAESPDKKAGNCPAIDFNQFIPQSYGGAQDRGQARILDDGKELFISNNGWKAIYLNYEVTEETIVEFEFKSTSPAEIHGIGFDNDNSLDAAKTIQVGGTQSWGHTKYSDYEEYGEWRSYRIPVGEFYTGAFNRLFFTADHDGGSRNGNSFFRNVRLYEGSTCTSPLPAPIAEKNLQGEGNEELLLYPNPVADQLNVALEVLLEGTVDIEIFDLAGRRLLAEQYWLNAGSHNITLSCSELPSGSYVLYVRQEEGRQTSRFSVIH